MDLQNIVIAHHHINLVRAIKDYHIRHYIWEIAKVLIPVFITGFITVVVMRANDNRNKKRWLNEGYLKRKVELEIELRKVLLNLKRKLDLFPELKELEEIMESLDENYLIELNQINQTFWIVKKEITKYVDLGNMKIATENPNDDYDIESLIDEYLVFVKNKNIFNNYKKQYRAFMETPVSITKTKKDCLGNDEEIGISVEDLNSEKVELIQSKIEIIYIFKLQTEKLIDIIEKNFKTSHK